MENRKLLTALLVNAFVLVLLVATGVAGARSAEAKAKAQGQPLTLAAFADDVPQIGGISPCPPPFDQECPAAMRAAHARR